MSWSDLGGALGATDHGFFPLPAEAVPQGASPAGPFPDLGASPAEAASPEAEPTESEAAVDAGAEAVREAYARGVDAGRDAARAELAELAAGFVAAAAEVARFRAGLVERQQASLVDLAFAVAGKIVRAELVDRPERWLAMIRAGAQQALARESMRLRVGPTLHAYLAEHTAELRAQLDGVRELDLVLDPALGDTGCTIETAFGDVDLGVDEQIEGVKTALAEEG